MTRTPEENARAKALSEAADYAQFYGEERFALCGYSIIYDPVLAGGRTARDLAKSEELQVDGTINSAAYHAAMHIAEHLRKLAAEASA